MHNVRIYDTDTIDDIAHKIYEDFDVLASCSVFGFVIVVEEGKKDRLMPKGELVLSQLKKLYEMEHMKKNAVGTMLRQWKFRKDSIGGPIAHKIFTWEKRIVENEPRYNIWRVQ